MPKLNFDAREECCHESDANSHLDHAKHFRSFSLERLAWAIQNGANMDTDERYLKNFEPSNVNKELLGVVEGQSLGEAFPKLFFAVQSNSSEIVRALCNAGADPRRRIQHLNLPILPYTVISSEYELLDKTDILLLLLAKGADPCDIPSDMWEEPLKAPKGDMSRKPRWGGTIEDNRWHLPGVLKALARNLTLAHRFLLWRTGHFEFRQERLLQVTEEFSLLPLLEIPFHIVGQTYAINQIIGEVVSHFLFKSEFPLILLFTGLSGHGKTEIAKQMGRLLSLDIHNVDCTEMKYETDIFGPKFPYLGHEQGSRLNNFLANHAGERAIVFFGEFDKTTEEVRKALLLPFDSGAYVDRRYQKKLDMSKIIWILAANFGEREIQEHWSSQIEGRSEASQKSEDFKNLSRILNGLIIGKIGAPLFGRIFKDYPISPIQRSRETCGNVQIYARAPQRGSRSH